MICNHLNALGTYLYLHSTTYEKVLILCDFNVRIEEEHMKAFRDNYNLTSLIKTLKKKTLWPLFMDGVQLPQG